MHKDSFGYGVIRHSDNCSQKKDLFHFYELNDVYPPHGIGGTIVGRPGGNL